MAKKTRSEWLRTVRRYADEGGSGAIGKVTGYDDDGRPVAFDECSLEEFEAAKSGHFVLVDSDGAVITDCLLGNDGERVMPRRAIKSRAGGMLGDSVEREIGKNLSNLAEQWGGLNVAAQAMIDKLIARNDKLQAELDEAKTQLAEQIASGGEDGSEWVELAKSALDVVTGKATKEALGRIAQRMIASGAIDPNTSKEIITALNQAVASENMGVNPLTLITGGKESAK